MQLLGFSVNEYLKNATRDSTCSSNASSNPFFNSSETEPTLVVLLTVVSFSHHIQAMHCDYHPALVGFPPSTIRGTSTTSTSHRSASRLFWIAAQLATIWISLNNSAMGLLAREIHLLIQNDVLLYPQLV